MDTNNPTLVGQPVPVKTLTNRANQWPKICLDSQVDDAGLSTNAFRVYLHLWRRGDNEAHTAWPGLDSIASVCLMNRKTVMLALKELEEKRFIKVKRRKGKQSNYEILPKHCWAPVPKTDHYQSLKRTTPVPKTDYTSPFNGPPPVRQTDTKVSYLRYPYYSNPNKADANLGWSKDKTPKEYLDPEISPDPREQGSVARLARNFLQTLNP